MGRESGHGIVSLLLVGGSGAAGVGCRGTASARASAVPEMGSRSWCGLRWEFGSLTTHGGCRRLGCLSSNLRSLGRLDSSTGRLGHRVAVVVLRLHLVILHG